MIVLQGVEQAEGVAVLLPGIEHDNLVFIGLVIVLVKSQELVDPKIREHGADAIEEHIGIAYAILSLFDVFFDTVLDIFEEFRAVRVAGQRLLYVCDASCVASCFLLKEIMQHGGVPQKSFIVKKIAELIEEVQRKYVLIACRTLEVTLELLYLPPHFVFLRGWILKDVIVVEQVVLSILEFGAVQLLV